MAKTMLQKVADALRQSGGYYDCLDDDKWVPIDTTPLDIEAMAAAAIAAMREPTALMIERGHVKALVGSEAPECYRDMIDAALSE